MSGYADTPDVSQVTLSRTTTPSSEFVVFVSNIIQGLWRNVEIAKVREKVSKSERQSFQTYVYRVMRRAKLSYAAIIIALNYINLLSKKRDEMPSLRIRTAECMATEEARIVVVSFILANKHFYDHAYRNKTWSKMTGIDKNVLYYCEKEALAALNYDLTVTPQKYAEWLSTLEATADVIEDDINYLNETVTRQRRANSPANSDANVNYASFVHDDDVKANKTEENTEAANNEQKTEDNKTEPNTEDNTTTEATTETEPVGKANSDTNIDSPKKHDIDAYPLQENENAKRFESATLPRNFESTVNI